MCNLAMGLTGDEFHFKAQNRREKNKASLVSFLGLVEVRKEIYLQGSCFGLAFCEIGWIFFSFDTFVCDGVGRELE